MSRIVPIRPRAVAAATGLILVALGGVGFALRSPSPVAASDLDRLALRVVEGGEGVGALVLEGLSVGRWRALEASLGRAADGPEWSRLVRILPEPPLGERAATLPATAGRYSRRGAALRFTPSYPLEPGLAYRAELRLPDRGEEAPYRVLRARPPLPEGGAGRGAPPPRIVAVYPTADQLPENQLKLYLYFSHPMGAASPWPYLRLLDEEGREQRDVFHAAAELWDRDRRRLTVLFDPGRIKRGLVNHETLGAPLRRGRSYRLVVAEGWPDAAGRPLAEGFEKRFAVGPPDRRRPNPRVWRLGRPRPGTRAPLVVHLREPLDHALLARSLAVLRLAPTPAVVAGEAIVTRRETLWRFTPVEPWPAGEFVLRIDPLLEDLAGNNLERLFDIDLARRPGGGPRVARTRLFRLGASPPAGANLGERL